MKKFLLVLLLVFAAIVTLSGCESEPETPKTIYDYGVNITESDYEISGKIESAFVGNKIIVSKVALSEWEEKGADSKVWVGIEAFDAYVAVPRLSDEYNKNYWLWYEHDYYAKEHPDTYETITTVDGEIQKITNEELRDQYKKNMDEFMEEFKKNNMSELEKHIKQLGIECSTNDQYVLAKLDWEQLLTLLDTHFVLIAVCDTNPRPTSVG